MKQKLFTQLWGVNMLTISTTGSLDKPASLWSSPATAINSPVVTMLWLPKKED